jgi:trigger factor
VESNIKELEGCMRELEITLSEDEVQPRYHEAYKQAQMSINMPGFRPGRVPVKMIKKRFGAQIEMEADQELINEVFPKIAEEKQLSIVGQPQLVNIDKETGGGVKFTIRFETIPEINLGDYKGLVVDEPVYTVEDEEIEKEIQGFRHNNAKEEHAEKVEEGDYKVDLILNEIDEETGMPLVGSKENKITVLTSDNRWPEEMLKNPRRRRNRQGIRIFPTRCSKTRQVQGPCRPYP